MDVVLHNYRVKNDPDQIYMDWANNWDYDVYQKQRYKLVHPPELCMVLSKKFTISY